MNKIYTMLGFKGKPEIIEPEKPESKPKKPAAKKAERGERHDK